MNDDVVDRVKERIDIVDLIGRSVTLRKAGKTFKGLCPFHQEKTPSFTVFPETQPFHCFGCGAGGDAFSFIMQQERVDFSEALRELAREAGVPLERRPTAPPPEQVARHARLYELNRLAANWFSHVLWQTPQGEPGRRLLDAREIDRATAERFQLGFAPDRWEALGAFLSKRGASHDEMLEAGLVVAREDGATYDRFRNRLMFPISDAEGRVAGFGGRALGDAKPKYLNTSQTPIFDKGALLYAFDLAREAIRRERTVVVVEGYMDAIAAHQFGFENVVASMGTALTEEQARRLRRGVDRVILALDADAAGQLATLRGLDVLGPTPAEEDQPIPDAAGLVRFERTLRAEIRIVRLPAGKDPDELIRRDVDAWRAALAGAVPLLDFYVDTLIGDPPPGDPREKSRIVQQLAPVLREIDDRVVRSHYVTEVARRLQINERDVLAPTRPSRHTHPAAGRVVTVSAPRQTISPEEHLFALLLTHPLITGPLLPTIPEQDILDARHVAILRSLQAHPVEEAEQAIAQLPEELRSHAAHLQALLADRPNAYPGQIRVDAEAAIGRLRKERHDERMRQLREQITDAERSGDRETVRETLTLIDHLKEQYPEFYPKPSPYFRDTRDAVG